MARAESRGGGIVLVALLAMTGLHAIHVTVGICLTLGLALLARRGHFEDGNYMPVDIACLYWHFVDIVWVFLFPWLYLAVHL